MQCKVLHQSHHGRVRLTDGHLLIDHVGLFAVGLHLLLPAEGTDIAGVPLHLVGVVVEGSHNGAGRRPAGAAVAAAGGRFEGVVGLSQLRLHHGHILHLQAVTAGAHRAHRVPQLLRGGLETLSGRDWSVSIELILQGCSPSVPRPPSQAELAQLDRQPRPGARLQLGLRLVLVY